MSHKTESKRDACIEAATRAAYARQPASDQETDAEGCPFGPAYELTFEQAEEAYPEHIEWLRGDATAAFNAIIGELANPDEGMLGAIVDNLFGWAADDPREDARQVWTAALSSLEKE